MRRSVLPALLLCAFAAAARAETSDQAVVKDRSANFVETLFASVCIPAIGKPNEVENWASAHNLPEIHDPAALAIFVGPGDGKAWGVPQSYGSFALSVRGTTKACAAWARNADGDDSEKLFRKLMEGTRRTGFDVHLDQDSMVDVSGEHRHVITYSLYPTESKVGATAISQTTKRPEGDALVEMEIGQSTR